MTNNRRLRKNSITKETAFLFPLLSSGMLLINADTAIVHTLTYTQRMGLWLQTQQQFNLSRVINVVKVKVLTVKPFLPHLISLSLRVKKGDLPLSP